MIFLNQLLHDRMLATAQNRAQAAHVLGAVLLQESKLLRDVRQAKPVKTIPTRLLGAIEDTRAVLDGIGENDRSRTALDAVSDLSDSLATVVKFVFSKREREIQMASIPYVDAIVASCLDPFRARMVDLAQVLVRWDGIGMVPSAPGWENEDVVTLESAKFASDAMEDYWQRNRPEKQPLWHAIRAFLFPPTAPERSPS
jgi:hypothetical protein